MKERRIYGPCGPLPPSTSSVVQRGDTTDDAPTGEHTWVDRIYEGYGDESTTANLSINQLSENDIEVKSLPAVEDPWDEFRKYDADEIPPLHLETPRGLDHRYFVSNAPRCFTDSLFEEHDDDEEHHLLKDDDDDEELPFPDDDEE
jgi:hypothetical protein